MILVMDIVFVMEKVGVLLIANYSPVMKFGLDFNTIRNGADDIEVL